MTEGKTYLRKDFSSSSYPSGQTVKMNLHKDAKTEGSMNVSLLGKVFNEHLQTSWHCIGF